MTSIEVRVNPFTHRLFTRILRRERDPHQIAFKRFDPSKDIIPWTDTIEQNKAVDTVLDQFDRLTDLRKRKGLPLMFARPLSRHDSFSLWSKEAMACLENETHDLKERINAYLKEKTSIEAYHKD